MTVEISNEQSSEFIGAVTTIGKRVAYRDNPQGFYPKGNRNGREITFEEVENMLMDELLKTPLHYDTVGEAEFQRLLNHGIKVLDGSQPLELSAAQEEEQIADDEEDLAEDEEGEEEAEEEDAEEEEDTEEETAMSLLCEFISEVIEEAKANESIDEEYLHQRIEMGLRTRRLEVELTE